MSKSVRVLFFIVYVIIIPKREKENQMKNPLKSKTFCLMLLGLAALGVQIAVGEQVIPYEYQGLAIAAAGLVLRFVTSEGISLPGVGSPKP